MKFMEQLQTELKQAIVQHQHQLLLEVLQRRSQELTLGDLRKLLASPLGRGLDDVRLALIFGAVTAPKSLPVAEAKPQQTRVSKPQDKRPAGKQKTARDQRSNPSQELVDAVVAALQSAKGPLSTTQLGAKLNVHRTTVRAALHKLDAQKRVTISGKGKFTRYASKSAQPATASESTPPTKGRKRRGKSKKAAHPAAASSQPAPSPKARKRSAKSKKAAQPAAKPGPLDEQSYDAAVLSCLREKGQAASSEIVAAVGGTIDRLRAALIRLAATGQIVRTGERKLTRYSLASQG